VTMGFSSSLVSTELFRLVILLLVLSFGDPDSLLFAYLAFLLVVPFGSSFIVLFYSRVARLSESSTRTFADELEGTCSDGGPWDWYYTTSTVLPTNAWSESAGASEVRFSGPEEDKLTENNN